MVYSSADAMEYNQKYSLSGYKVFRTRFGQKVVLLFLS